MKYLFELLIVFLVVLFNCNFTKKINVTKILHSGKENNISNSSENIYDPFFGSKEILDQNGKSIKFKNLKNLLSEKKYVNVEINKVKYKIKEKLGTGYFFDVYKLESIDGPKKQYALKIPQNFFASNRHTRKDTKDFKYLVRSGLHKYIPKATLTYVQDNNKRTYFIFREYFDGITLCSYINSNSFNKNEFIKILKITIKIICTISEIGSGNLDPGLTNFMLSKNDIYDVKLVDFWLNEYNMDFKKAFKNNIFQLMMHLGLSSFGEKYLQKKYKTKCRWIDVVKKELYQQYININKWVAKHKEVQKITRIGLFVPNKVTRKVKSIIEVYTLTLWQVFCDYEKYIDNKKILIEKIYNLFDKNLKIHQVI